MVIFERPNAKKTGAKLEVMTCQTPFHQNAVKLNLYPQKMSDGIEYEEDSIKAILCYEDLSLILMVLLGYEESILSGKGIYHVYKNGTVRILFRHAIIPTPVYELEIVNVKNDGSDVKRARISLQTQDAIVLSYGIQGVLQNSIK